MKIGVDGVLIGSWADCSGERILDVGTGCGVIALMMAQRNPDAQVYAIDIDKDSIAEAKENFHNSPWEDRLHASVCSFNKIRATDYGPVDLIVSNPPFFDSGVTEFISSRIKARHQGDLSPFSLLDLSGGLLTENGRLAMIVPYVFLEKLIAYGKANGFYLSRWTGVRNNCTSQVKRVMLEFSNGNPDGNGDLIESGELPILTMFAESGEPTDEYRLLGREFYLKF